MTTSAFAIADHSAAASAPRQHAFKLARSLEFSDSRAGQVALIASEFGTNVAKHAYAGQILVQEIGDEHERGVEILSIDKGPGIPPQAIYDGFSTTGSLGAGLGALRRQADEFDVFSQPGVGVVAVARVWKSGAPRGSRNLHAGLNVAKAGELVSGDAWDYRSDGSRRSFLLVDGLGHGPQAAEAAEAAIHIFRQRAYRSSANLIEEIHLALRATRGAAVAIAVFDTERQVLQFTGVGNVVAALLTPDEPRRSLASHNGTAGLAIRRVHEFTYPVAASTVLVMHSDGLTTHWTADAYPGLWARDPALIAGALYRDHTRGRDDASIVVAHLRA